MAVPLEHRPFPFAKRGLPMVSTPCTHTLEDDYAVEATEHTTHTITAN